MAYLNEKSLGPAKILAFLHAQKAAGVQKAALPKPSDLWSQHQWSEWWIQNKKTEKLAKKGFEDWYSKLVKKVFEGENATASTPATPTSILRNSRVTFSDTPDAAATPSSFFATPTIPTPMGVAGAPSSLLSCPMNSSAKKPSPPPSQRKKKTSKVELDVENTDFDTFFIAPKAVKVESRTVAPMLILLPSTITSETDIVVVVGKTECKVTFTVPTNLVNPKHMCPFKCTINKGSDKSGVTHNGCVDHLESLVEKAGDAISYDIHFDLPFECSPYLASDLLPGHLKGDIPVAKSYVGPEWTSPQDVKKYAKPDDWVHTLVLLFEKVDSGFLATKKVKIAEDSPGKSSDDDWEW